MQTKIIEDGGTTLDFWIIKVHTSNYLLYNTETKQDTDMIHLSKLSAHNMIPG